MSDEDEIKLSQIINLLIEFSQGNFDNRPLLSPADDDDPLSAVLSGLNMLGEELSYAKKNREAIELEREKLIAELSKRYNELTQFNYIVSHNLRTPVVQILGLVDLLEYESSEEEKLKLCKYIINAATSMDELLKDLNTILSAKSSLNDKNETFKISTLIDSLLILLAQEIKTSKVKIDVLVDDDADEILTVKSYLQSILFNVISNAIKYVSNDEPREIKVSVYRDKNQTNFIIADNGIGIDLKLHKDRIFGFYSRINTNKEGKGLGLYMTKVQLETLGGSIDVESELGVGTKFIIKI